MQNKIFILLLVFLFAACTGNATPVPAPSEAELATEEQAVYAALLQQMYGASMYVLMDTTSGVMTEPGDIALTIDYISLNMTSILPETMDTFFARNKTDTMFGTNLDLGAEYILLSEEEMNDVLNENFTGWDIFYEQYPDAPGIITLSRVGFNNTLDQALIYMEWWGDWEAGAGYYILLNKEDGNWVVTQQVDTWVS